jgi:Leucine-rich repeat (LRR) protein
MAGWRVKLWTTLTLVVFTMGIFLPATKVSAADQVVSFTDANLQAAIRQAINKPSGDIYQSNLQDLTELNIPGMMISNLAGLESCTNLTYLNLSVNQISDISSLASLTNLTSLYLNQNQISDISPLVTSSGLFIGDTVYLNNNPLSLTSNLLYVPLLIGKGVNVSDYSPPWIFLICILAGLVLILVLFQRRRIENNRLKEEIIADIDEALQSIKTS